MTDGATQFAVNVDVGRQRVEAWSTRRLPFEPRGPMLAFRAELRAALARLEPGNGRLHCVYAARSADLCDAENVLLYNVGPSHFSALARRSLVFERSYDPPPCPTVLAAPAEHHYLYQAGSDTGFACWQVTARVASFHGRAPRRRNEATDWWWSTRSSASEVTVSDLSKERFGLHVRLSPTSRSLTGLLKPMLDGIVAAFHRDSSPDPVAVRRLASELSVAAERIDAQLRVPLSPLGDRRVVWAYRQGVQWNPGDDLCVACGVELDDRLAPDVVEAELLRLSEPSAGP